jgi:hypothetical protein
MMEAVRISETSVDNHFTRQYNPEDSSEHHTRRRENLKSHKFLLVDAMSLSCVEVYLSLSANMKLMYSLVPIPHNFLQAPGRKNSSLIASQLTLTISATQLKIWRSNCRNRTKFISWNRKIAFDTTETICYNP